MSERDIRVLYLSRILTVDGSITDLLVIREHSEPMFREVGAIKESQILAGSPWMAPVLGSIEDLRRSFEGLASTMFNVAHPDGADDLTCALCLEFEGDGLPSYQTIFLGLTDPQTQGPARAAAFKKVLQWGRNPVDHRVYHAQDWAPAWFYREVTDRLAGMVNTWLEAHPSIKA